MDRGLGFLKGADDEPVEFMPDGHGYELLDIFAKPNPSDRFEIPLEDVPRVIKVWRDGIGNKPPYIPSDLFFAGAVPVTDCEITVVPGKGDRTVRLEVAVRPYYQAVLAGAREGETEPVGLVTLFGNGITVHYVFAVQKGHDGVFLSQRLIGYGNSEEAKRHFSERSGKRATVRFFYEVISLWYGIQVSLLHPHVTERMRTGVRRKERIPKKERRKGGRITKYVRVHYIDRDDIDKMLSPRGVYARHTLAWYVIGHWRRLPNGGTTFVKPYWKGPCREMKMNLDDGRDRRLVLPDGGAI